MRLTIATLLFPSSQVRLAAMRGEVVVLNFWASWCLECQTEHATLSNVAQQYVGKPVHFVGVLYNAEPKSATDWTAQLGVPPTPARLDPPAPPPSRS